MVESRVHKMVAWKEQPTVASKAYLTADTKAPTKADLKDSPSVAQRVEHLVAWKAELRASCSAA